MNGQDRDLNFPAADAATDVEKFLGCDLPEDADLKAAGWTWRCNADDRRSRELIDTYTELGFEVRLESIDVNAMCDDCGGCKSAMAAFSAVYTRKKKPAA